MKQLLFVFVLSCITTFLNAQQWDSVATNRGSVFTRAEVAPAFVGGAEAWCAFVQKNIKTKWPKRHPGGSYKVIVQFIVQRDGSLTDVKALTYHGHGVEEETKRIIKLSPRWIAAKQNGQDVAAYVKQPIQFEIY